MAYGRYTRRNTRRRLTGNAYAKSMGYKAVRFTRKRPYPFRPGGGTTTGQSAPPRLGRRVRPKLARSYTATKTKTETQRGRVVKTSDNASFSVVKLGRSAGGLAYPIYKALSVPQTIVDSNSSQVLSAVGRQAVLLVIPGVMFSTTALVNIKAAIAVTNRNLRIFLKKGRVKYTFRNQTNCNMRISIYDIMTKSYGPTLALDSPTDAWAKGLTDFGPTYTINTVGATPNKSPEFKKQFRVASVTTLSLEPGQQHEHMVYHTYNRLIDSTIFDNWSGTSESIKGITRWTMVVFHGALVHESVTPDQVTYANTTLDYAVHREYSYAWLEKAVPSLTFTDNLPSTIIDPDQMGETGDQDVNVLNA